MIGMRTFKTALGVALCMLFYILFIPVSDNMGPFYACIAIVISMQPTSEGTKHIAKNRVIGTMIGGVTSAILYSLYIKLAITLLSPILLFIGVILTILICNKLGFQAGISTGCIVLIGAFTLDFPNSAFLHAFFRTIDTTIGVIIAYIINVTLPGGEQIEK